MASLRGVLETCLYASDLPAIERFYGDVLGLEVIDHEPGRHCFFRCGEGVLLVFDPARTEQADQELPAHGARGSAHVAFRVAPDELDGWRARLRDHGVAIEADVAWPRGVRSLYFRDPAGNLVELAPAGLWGLT